MNSADDILFSLLRIGTLSLPARLFKTATAETRASADGFVTDAVLDFYEPMARAGTPLIITGNIYISRQESPRPSLGRTTTTRSRGSAAWSRRCTRMAPGSSRSSTIVAARWSPTSSVRTRWYRRPR